VQTFITGLGVPQKRKWPKLDRQALKNVDSSRAEFSEIQYCWYWLPSPRKKRVKPGLPTILSTILDGGATL